MQSTTSPAEKKKIRRFYKTADVAPFEGGYQVHLDGRPLKTPLRHTLLLPNAEMAEAVAAEWQAQGEEIDPFSMPMTRLANTAQDRIGEHRDVITQELVRFANGDQLCYRADYPEVLIERQGALWDPLLEWLEETHAIRLDVTKGIVPIDQDAAMLARFEEIYNRLDAYRFTALHNIVTLCTSVTIGLAVLAGKLTVEQAWAAAHVDETFQIENWGTDSEAEARQAELYKELVQAIDFLRLCP